MLCFFVVFLQAFLSVSFSHDLLFSQYSIFSSILCVPPCLVVVCCSFAGVWWYYWHTEPGQWDQDTTIVFTCHEQTRTTGSTVSSRSRRTHQPDVFQFLWSVTSWPAQLTSRLSTHRSVFCSSRGIISRGAGEEDKGYRGHWGWLLCSSGFQIISGRHQGTSLALSLPILFAFRLISIYSFIWFPFAELCSVCLQMKWFPLNSVCSVHLSSGSWKACARWWAAPGLVHSLHRQLYWIWSRQHSRSPLKLDY